MAETRMLPKSTPRSTGIARSNTQVARPPAAAGAGPNSHVSSSPGASKKTHDHVVDARRPTGAGGRASDAKVEIVDRGAAGAGRGKLSTNTSVQVIDRSQAGGLAVGSVVAPPLTPEQSSLTISLLEQYAERAQVIGSPDAEVARSAARVVHEMLLAGRSLAKNAPPVQVRPPQAREDRVVDVAGPPPGLRAEVPEAPDAPPPGPRAG